MDDLVLQLAESEIRLGFAFVQAGHCCLMLRDLVRLHQSCDRAEASYLRARKHILELPDDIKLSAAADLETLRTSIDQFVAKAPAASGDLQAPGQDDMLLANSVFASAAA